MGNEKQTDYNNVEWKKVLGKKKNEKKWASVNHSASGEGGVMYLVGLERHCVLQASAKPDVKFRELLFPNGLIKSNNWWKAPGLELASWKGPSSIRTMPSSHFFFFKTGWNW